MRGGKKKKKKEKKTYGLVDMLTAIEGAVGESADVL